MKAIDALDSSIGDPRRGLPEEVFLFASRITPMINVDLLIKNEGNQTLLTWRADGYWEPGWHIPGGIIRYKETIAERIRAVAKMEVGAEVDFHEFPLSIREFIQPVRRNRGHFVSLLYRCSLKGEPDEALHYKSGDPKPGQWMWHSTCPENIISVHDVYRQFI